jgi:hypothetical protein
MDEEQKKLNFPKLELISCQIEEIRRLQKPLLKLYEVGVYVLSIDKGGKKEGRKKVEEG